MFKLIAFGPNVIVLLVIIINIRIFFTSLQTRAECCEFSIKSFIETVYVLNNYDIFLEANSSSAGQELPAFY
jgi:hypothetical protein